MVFGGFLVRGLRYRLSRLTRHQTSPYNVSLCYDTATAITTSRSAFFFWVNQARRSLRRHNRLSIIRMAAHYPSLKGSSLARHMMAHLWWVGYRTSTRMHTTCTVTRTNSISLCRRRHPEDQPLILYIFLSHTREQLWSTRWLCVVFPEHQENRVVGLETISKRGCDSNSERGRRLLGGFCRTQASVIYVFRHTFPQDHGPSPDALEPAAGTNGLGVTHRNTPRGWPPAGRYVI